MNSATNSFFCAIAAAGIAVLSSAVAPANAYSVQLNDRTAGNPSGQKLYDIGLDQYDIGRTLDPVTWLLKAGTGNDQGDINTVDISAKAIIKVLALDPNSLKLSFNFTNTTDVTYQSSVVSFGFGVSPNAGEVSFSKSGNIFDNARILPKQQNYPGGFKQIDVCVFSSNGCTGGDIKNGLLSGQSDFFELLIKPKQGTSFFNSSTGSSQVTLSDLPIKFQTQDGSYELAGVPEPITVVGSGLALGFGALFKQKAAKKLKKAEVKG